MGLPGILAGDGHDVEVVTVESTLEPATEIAVSFDLARSISTAVRDARGASRLPLVLAGGCFSAVGTLAGLGARSTGVIWLDAHGDFNTPETTTSGFLDGMALATVTGRCWRGLVEAVPDFAPLPDHRLVLVGARDLDAPEEAMAAALGIQLVRVSELRAVGADQALQPKLERIADIVDRFYLHVDLDVLDPEIARSNQYAAPGGLNMEQIETIAGLVANAAEIGAASITALDPAFDQGGVSAQAAIAIARAIVAAAEARPKPRPA